MSSVKILKSLPLTPGVILQIKHNEAEPAESTDAYHVDVTASGEEGTDAVYVPPHWHKYHAERVTVLEGRLKVSLNGEEIVLKAGDPQLLIPRRVVHSFQGFKGERLVVREQAEPGGDYKALFFNDMLSGRGFGNIPHVIRAFYDGDAYLALPLYFQFLDEVFITVVGGVVRLFDSPKPTSF